MTAARFAGARLDDEIVLLDRSSNSLVHLNAAAVRVWEACGPAKTDDAAASPPAGSEAAEDASVRMTLTEAGLLRRVDDRYVRVPVEWR
jgi:hypothetical protein